MKRLVLVLAMLTVVMVVPAAAKADGHRHGYSPGGGYYAPRHYAPHYSAPRHYAPRHYAPRYYYYAPHRGRCYHGFWGPAPAYREYYPGYYCEPYYGYGGGFSFGFYGY